MPPVEEIGIHGTAVYWEKLRVDRYGEDILAAPREVECRWIDGQTDLLDAQGNVVTVEAVAVVKEDLVIGSILREGTLSDYPGSANTADDDTVCYVRLTNKVPDLDNRFFYRSVGLSKYGNKA